MVNERMDPVFSCMCILADEQMGISVLALYQVEESESCYLEVAPVISPVVVGIRTAHKSTMKNLRLHE